MFGLRLVFLFTLLSFFFLLLLFFLPRVWGSPLSCINTIIPWARLRNYVFSLVWRNLTGLHKAPSNNFGMNQICLAQYHSCSCGWIGTNPCSQVFLKKSQRKPFQMSGGCSSSRLMPIVSDWHATVTYGCNVQARTLCSVSIYHIVYFTFMHEHKPLHHI